MDLCGKNCFEEVLKTKGFAYGIWKDDSNELIRRVAMETMEKAVAPQSSTLAWKIPWTEEPGGLLTMGSLRLGYD